jgi:hypothetical protein
MWHRGPVGKRVDGKLAIIRAFGASPLNAVLGDVSVSEGADRIDAPR